MNESVFNRFPEYRDQVTALLRENTTFGEICADYEEINTWLAARCQPDEPSTEECDEARQVMRNLEEEIKRVLRGAGVAIGNEE